ncbi:MAG: OmpA family protein [Polyangiaceae bacterium]
MALAAPAVTGCVTKERYLAALGDASYARNQAVEAQARLVKALDDIKALEKDIADRDAKLNELTASSANLSREIEELQALNVTLSDRLRRAGQSVESLATDKSTLAKDLSETKKQLEELRKQQALADARAHELQTLVGKFQGLTDAGKLEVSVRDGRLMLDLPNDVLFESGRDELLAVGKETLLEVAAVLKTISDRRFQVAGHTDNVKISTNRFPSNWELSTARAVRVTRLLQEAGVQPAQLSAAGYGEYDPAFPNDTGENRAKNRRIEISVVPDLSGLAPAPAPATEKI